jgi:FdhD protein
MLATPQDLEEFAIGFSLSEGIVQGASEISGIDIQAYREGVEVNVTIPFERYAALSGKERNLAGRTGCGLCGARSLEQAVRHPKPVSRGVTISSDALHRAIEAIQEHQVLNSLTGAVHAAAWSTTEGSIALVREDVGRHNALDKVIGALSRKQTDFTGGFMIVTSRASYEMVQKAATVGVTFVAAVSAPTGLAIRLAHETGVTLVGFARPHNHVIYANPQRIENKKETS